MGLANTLGWTGVDNFISPRRNTLTALGASLLSGRPGVGVSEGIQADTAYAVNQKAEADRAAQINQTAQWARSQFPQLAGAPDELVAQMAPKLWENQLTGGSSNLPANIQEWEYFSKLSPEQQTQYLTMKRSNPYLDVGTGFVQPNPIAPGTTSGPAIVKNGDVPTGFQQNPEGGISPMPGGEQDIERQTNLFKMEQRAVAADQKSEVVINAIDQATDQSTWATTGVLGNMGRGVGLTPHRDLQGTIDTIRANLGFAELQAMRDASPTGGALGQVAIQELAMLQSTIASLDPSQSEEQLDKNLKIIKELLERQKMYRQAALQEQAAILGGGQAAPAGGGTNVDDLLKKYQ